MARATLAVLLASTSAANPVRVANSNINLPTETPTGSYSLPDAFSGLSFSSPVCLASPPGDTQRLFVCEKGGSIKVVNDVTASTPSASTFLNVAGLFPGTATNKLDASGECGLLGLAFHPNYATNRYFYVFYSVIINGSRYQRVSRFTTSSGNPNIAESNSEWVLIEQFDEQNNHNGGDLHFGSDGYLYISVGDEGGGNDSWNNSQTINKDLFGGILRIDVDKKPSNVEPTANAAIPLDSGNARFSIPIDNPFVHTSLGGPWDGTYNGSAVSQTTVRREFYATGLRNPWRMSFDSITGKLWCADVGQSSREEIDIIEKGANYGWAYYEGNNNGAKIGSAPAGFDQNYHTRPYYEYGRGSSDFLGTVVTGGRVYRGSGIPALYGLYIFSDLGSGNIWALSQPDSNPPVIQKLTALTGVSAFGADPSNGDILLADLYGHRVRRLVSSTPTTSIPATLSATGLFSDTANLTPAAGMVPYEVNLPFWSDHAIKRRWFIIPNGTSQITWAKDSPWQFPTGTVWVKHFDIESERGNPATLKRIETRVTVKTSTGIYGLSYKWNAAETEAYLVDQSGDDFDLNITVDSTPTIQPWRIPSRSECMTCHISQAGFALSFNTRQLNRDADMLGCIGNQLDTLDSAGFFTSSPDSPNLLPRHLRPDETDFSTEARIRSYLAVNCSYCHQDDGTAGAADWDGRPQLTLDETRLLHGNLAQNGGDPLNKLIVPGDTFHSAVLSHVSASNGFTRMPPIGSNVLDQDAIDLLTEWINTKLPARQTYSDWQLAIFGSDPNGAPELDADLDGSSNYNEFLHGTDPESSSDRPQIALTSSSGLQLGFTLPENRSFKVMTSTDLFAWEAWDIVENQGLPVSGSLIEIDVPTDSTKQFFSLDVSEN